MNYSSVSDNLGLVGRAISVVLGSLVILMAGLSFSNDLTASEIYIWTRDILGLGFITLTILLVFVSVFSSLKILETKGQEASDSVDAFRRKWMLSGLQACNGIATIALTFTLLGISLGIGSLSHGGLTPETINDIIAELTNHFSMAFMTSVIGLPLSAVLRTMIILINTTTMSSDRSVHHSQPVIAGE
jgi:hypothetical protein